MTKGHNMKRIIAGSAGIFATQAVLWPHHHLLAIVADVISIAAVATARKSAHRA